MSHKNRKQFGVWMDSMHATIVGKKDDDSSDFEVLCHLTSAGSESNSSEHTQQNAERGTTSKFFKEIAFKMQNAVEVHITGTGTVQEQFINYLASKPQFKNVITNETTEDKMSDEKLVEFISGQFK
jgi:stalled ribosome rescue protein Dom34